MLAIDAAHADDLSSDNMPLTPEEMLALMRGALGSDPATGLLLAVSGGPDSMALLGLAGAARAFLPPLAVATVNHLLRPEAAGEAAIVAEFSRAIGIPHQILDWQDRPIGHVSQDAARQGRYALLMSHARAIDASHIVTAHTLDDQAETVLIRLASGSGTAGLGAMRANIRRGAIGHLRPLLDIPKSRILATCTRHGWSFAQDPSNADPRFTRVRMRALMPLLANEGLTPERLATLAARARRTEDAIDHVANRTIATATLMEAADGGAIRLRADPFYSEPFEIALRMLKKAMLNIATEPAANAKIPLVKLEALLKNLRMAIRDQRPFRQTLAWAVIAHGSGFVEVRTAPPRRHSRMDAH